MRLNPRGEVVCCSYDFETRRIGHIAVTLPIAFAEPFLPAASHWTRHDLWKALVSQDETVAAMIVNNVFLITVTHNSLMVQTKADRSHPQIAVADTELLFKPTIPIGFVRTCPEVMDVNVPPYLLFMDKLNRVSISGGELKTICDAVACTNMQLYKALITTNRPAVYMSINGPKYL